MTEFPNTDTGEIIRKNVSKHPPIPEEALGDRLGFVGTAGAGKTYNACGQVERILSAGSRAIIVDPLDVWWGLRLMEDGLTPSPHNVVIFGGAHADIEINELSGALIGETVAGMAESCIVSFGNFETAASERRFMLAFLTALYRHANRQPLHLIFDEADMHCPQRILDKEGESTKLLGRMETIVRRGRIRGFIPWLITQRPAVINKNVLSQMDGLVAFKLTSSHDRDQLGSWVEGQAEKGAWKEIHAKLPTLQRGEGVVWLPGHGVLDTIKFPKKCTYDSSATPKAGEQNAVAILQPLDVGALKKALAAVEEDIKANDPGILKKRIADLERALAKARQNIPENITPDPAALETAGKEGYRKGYSRGTADVADLAKRLDLAWADIFDATDRIGHIVDEIKNLSEKHRHGATLKDRWRPSGGARPTAPERAATPVTTYPDGPLGENSGDISKPLQRIVDAIRWWAVLGVSEPSQAQVAFIAGYSHKSGTWSTYLSRLRSMGLIDGRGNLCLSADGAVAANEPASPPTAHHLRRTVLAKVDGPLSKILGPIIEAYPDSMAQSAAADASGYSPNSGTWSTYLSRLRSLDLIRGRGELKASDWLFP